MFAGLTCEDADSEAQDAVIIEFPSVRAS